MGRKKTGVRRIRKKELKKNIVALFQSKPKDTFELRDICQHFDITSSPAKMLAKDIVMELLDNDYIRECAHHHYQLNVSTQVMDGVFHRKANGKNTFKPDIGGDPILVAERNSMRAMDGDRVRVTLMARRTNHMKEARVEEILKRSDKQFVGTLEVKKDYAYLLTEDRTLANDIFIPRANLKKGKTGDKAVVKIVEWPEDAKNPVGKVIEILGETGENNAEMHAILAEYGLPYTYPESVERAAEKIPVEIPEEEIERREDMREVLTFTIDPRDAKDFDDALSIRKLKENLWEVGVHIADVSAYVKEVSLTKKHKNAQQAYISWIALYPCSRRDYATSSAHCVLTKTN